jgi:hypothetical protein
VATETTFTGIDRAGDPVIAVRIAPAHRALAADAVRSLRRALVVAVATVMRVAIQADTGGTTSVLTGGAWTGAVRSSRRSTGGPADAPQTSPLDLIGWAGGAGRASSAGTPGGHQRRESSQDAAPRRAAGETSSQIVEVVAVHLDRLLVVPRREGPSRRYAPSC